MSDQNEIPWPGRPASPGPLPPSRIWPDPPADPPAGLPDKLYERLLDQRIALASGVLDDAAATRLSAQLLTLDAEGDGPVRLELQNLRAELPAALALMRVLDVVRAEVQAFASGEAGGPAPGVLASCRGDRPGRRGHQAGRATGPRAERGRGHRLRPDPRPRRQADPVSGVRSRSSARVPP